MTINERAMLDVPLTQASFADTKTIKQYKKLITVIEFFSQRFSLENMTQYMYDFVLEFFSPTRCVLMTLSSSSSYTVFASHNIEKHPLSFIKEAKHDQLVYFHPGLLDRAFLSDFLDEDIFMVIRPDIGIPIITDKTLYGIIFITTQESLNLDDLIIAESLMNIYHLALTNLKNYEQLEISKRELDEKIFNLFAMNQASKVLLKEQDPKKLMQLSLSVFSELVQSKRTSIFLKDALDQCYHLIDYTDVYNRNTKKALKLKADPVKKNVKTIIDWSDPQEKHHFRQQFSDSVEVLETFEPEFIVNFVNQNDLVGFVTISERVTGGAYDSGIFELIESLASSTYIAISNATNYAEVLKNKKLAESKLSRLSTLNRLIKNINCAKSINELADLTLDTLKIIYGFKTSCFVSCDGTDYTVLGTRNFSIDMKHIQWEKVIDRLNEGNLIIEHDVARIEMILGEKGVSERIQSLILVPVFIDGIEQNLLGALGLFDVEEGVNASEENLITLETVANLIAPIFYHLSEIERIRHDYIFDDI